MSLQSDIVKLRRRLDRLAQDLDAMEAAIKAEGIPIPPDKAARDLEIYKLREEGSTYAAIARAYGLTSQTARAIWGEQDRRRRLAALRKARGLQPSN